MVNDTRELDDRVTPGRRVLIVVWYIVVFTFATIGLLTVLMFLLEFMFHISSWSNYRRLVT